MVKLSTVATISAGQSAPKNNYFSENGIPFIRAGSLEFLINGKGLDCCEKINETNAKICKLKLYPKNAVLFAKSGMSANKGRVYKLERDSYVVSHLAVVVTDSCKLLPSYFMYWLKINSPRTLIKDESYPSISLSDIGNLDIDCPSIEEQQRIVKILDKAEEIRTKKKLANEKLDEFLKSTFIDMFGDPVTNPKGFAIKNLKDFYFDDKAVKCGPFGSALKKSEYVQKGIPVWNMDNITIKSEFIPKPNLYITEQKFNELQSYTAINNDIIISRAGTVGKMCVLEGLNSATIISTNLIRLRLNKSKLSPIWFIKLLEYNGNKVCRLKRGCDGAFTHMNTGILDNIYFPYPEIESQNLYVGIYKRVKAQKEKNQKVIEQMNNLFNSLMQQAFNHN